MVHYLHLKCHEPQSNGSNMALILSGSFWTSSFPSAYWHFSKLSYHLFPEPPMTSEELYLVVWMGNLNTVP
jgi:hypothetical protein